MKNIALKGYCLLAKLKSLALIQYNKAISVFIRPPWVNHTDQTLCKMIKDGCSVSRYGDGEFALMAGESLLFQPYSKALEMGLREIIKSNAPHHMVCIPNVFKSVDWCTDKSKRYWEKYLNVNRLKIHNMIDKNKQYYDTQVTRLYIDHKDKGKTKERFNKFRELWENRDVVIVEGA